MKFAQLCQHLSHIAQLSGRLEMTQALADVYHTCSPREAEIVSYLMLGQLRPVYHGTQFNVARKGMEHIVAHVLDVSVDEVQQQLRDAGDLGTVIAQGSWNVSTYLHLETVYDRLVTFEQISGAGSHNEKAQYLQDLLRDVTPQSAQFIVRMVLGKLRLGFSEMTIIKALSWYVTGDKQHKERIEHAYNICADIGTITRGIVSHGIEGIADIDIRVGTPIRMAAAERLPSLHAVIDRLGSCVAQPKLDGFRLQVHVSQSNGDQRISFFSRNLADMSHMFPDLRYALQHLNVASLIIEGEAIAYDESTGNYLSFQETVKRRRTYDVEEAMQTYPLYFIVFDIVYYDGRSMLDTPHSERRDVLCDLLQSYPDPRVRAVDEQPISDVATLQAYFNQMITDGLEGIIIRRPDAPYQPGKRSYNWIKFKRRQTNALEDTLDCVVLGYYYGHGRRAQFGIGAFLVGVYNAMSDQFETIAKVGTGLTDAGWSELKRTADAYVVSSMPSHVVCHPDLMPDVVVQPKIVVVIAADEITQSPMHTAGKSDSELRLALRFPRCIDYRWDKQPDQATSVHEVRTLYQHQ